MLGKGIEKSPLFIEISELIAPMGLSLVDAIRNDTAAGVQMVITIFSKEREVNTDDLSEVYNVIYPRYQVLLGERDLSLEVSSPGLQRNLRDYYEFKVFQGKMSRLYSVSISSWIEGYIERVTEDSVVLTEAIVVDTQEEKEEIELPFSDIAKAKLSFRWEENKK